MQFNAIPLCMGESSQAPKRVFFSSLTILQPMAGMEEWRRHYLRHYPLAKGVLVPSTQIFRKWLSSRVLIMAWHCCFNI